MINPTHRMAAKAATGRTYPMTWTMPPETVTLNITMPKPMPFRLDPAKTALVIVDMQEISRSSERSRDVIEGNVRLLEKARAAGAPVIFIQSMRTPSALEVTRFGKTLWRPEGSAEVEILHEIAPLPNEPVVKKYNHDPFVNTRLDALLAEMGIVPQDWTVLVPGVSAAACAHACAMGFSNRHFMTLIPMDATAAGTVEEEARVYEQYMGPGYAYNMAFTTSELVTFEPGAPAAELQMKEMRELVTV